MLGAVGKETSIAIEHLATDGQLDLRRLLDVAHPRAVHICGADVELVAIQNEPNCDFMGLPGLASIMSQGRGLLARYPLQSRKYVRFHKLSFRKLQQSQQKSLNVPKLFLRHAEIVPQFMDKRLADLVADFCFARTDRFDVLLIKHDVGWTYR